MHTNLGELHQISEKDAARLLETESSVGSLDYATALRAVRYMKPKRVTAGATLIREGDKDGNDFVMLILSGDVRVESRARDLKETMVIAVMSAGDLIGELGLINDTPRTASCIAATDLAIAVLSRVSMNKMLLKEPDVAARFLLALTSRLSNRIVETTNKLKLFVRLNAVLQNEVYMLMDAQEPKKKAPARSEMPTEPMALMTQPADLTEMFVSDRVAQSKVKTQRPTR